MYKYIEDTFLTDSKYYKNVKYEKWDFFSA